MNEAFIYGHHVASLLPPRRSPVRSLVRLGPPLDLSANSCSDPRQTPQVPEMTMDKIAKALHVSRSALHRRGPDPPSKQEEQAQRAS